jgi:hypothetical protein
MNIGDIVHRVGTINEQLHTSLGHIRSIEESRQGVQSTVAYVAEGTENPLLMGALEHSASLQQDLGEAALRLANVIQRLTDYQNGL